ncbi:MAG: hypothetical protein K0R90_574 [Oscillospiraceae bacterium]|jgi:hypothetical protein|nr:hypothetical protein [Oscillospiraceae bacterium]
MSISFGGVGQTVVTLECKTGISIGDIVSMKDNNEVQAAVVDEKFVGVCVSKNGTYAGIQIKGAVTVKYSGTAPTVGYQTLAAGADNTVAVKPTGITYLVVNVNSTEKTATIIL